MPYIDPDSRPKIATTIPTGLSQGDVTFIVVDIMDQWLGSVLSYDRICAAIGILECSKLEIYRKLAGPYEDRKEIANGTVFQERE